MYGSHQPFAVRFNHVNKLCIVHCTGSVYYWNQKTGVSRTSWYDRIDIHFLTSTLFSSR